MAEEPDGHRTGLDAPPPIGGDWGEAVADGWTGAPDSGDPTPDVDRAALSREERLTAAVEAAARRCVAEGLSAEAAEEQFASVAHAFNLTDRKALRAHHAEFVRLVGGAPGGPPPRQGPSARPHSTTLRPWSALTAEEQQRIEARVLAALELAPRQSATAAAALLRQAADGEGVVIGGELRHALSIGLVQRCRDAVAARERAAREAAAPQIERLHTEAADALLLLLRDAEDAPEDRAARVQEAVDLLRATASAIGVVLGMPAMALPPQDRVRAILDHPALERCRGGIERVFGDRLHRALEGATLDDLLPGCPEALVLSPPCPWHVQSDGALTMTVVERGEGGQEVPQEKRVTPTVLLPMAEHWSLVPWGLPSAGPAMLAQEYTWWRRAPGLRHGGEWVVGSAQASALWDRRKITALADAGLPIDSENAGDYLTWMQYVRDSRPGGAPRQPVFTQPGWHVLPDGTAAFVLGERVRTAAGVRPATAAQRQGTEHSPAWHRGMDLGTRQYLAEFRPAGDYRQSAMAWNDWVHEFPRLGALAGLAYSAALLPLLRHCGSLIDMAGFVVDCSGETGRGKSTAQRMVLSLAAAPTGRVVHSFNRTLVSTETILAASHCLPCAMEETQQLTQSGRDRDGGAVANVVYMVGQGRSRDRGAASGGNREARFWNSVLFLTAEQGIAGMPGIEDTGGERRVISIAPPFEYSAEMARRIKQDIEPTIAAHYGHVLPEVIDGLLRRAESLGGLDGLARELGAQHRAERAAFEAAWAEAHGPGFAADPAATAARVSRLSSLVAAGVCMLRLILAATHYETVYDTEALLREVRAAIIEDNLDSLTRGSMRDRYLDTLRDVLAQQTPRIAGLEPVDEAGHRQVPHAGYIGGVGKTQGVEVIGILATPLKEMMARAMGTYNGKAFLAAMEQAGVLVAAPGRAGKTARIKYTRADGQVVDLYHVCFRREAVAASSPE